MTPCIAASRKLCRRSRGIVGDASRPAPEGAPYEIAGQKTVQVVVTQYPQTKFQPSSAAFSAPEVDNSLAFFATAQNGSPAGDRLTVGQVANLRPIVNRPSGITCNAGETPAPFVARRYMGRAILPAAARRLFGS